MRKPIASDRFYSGNPEKLQNQINNSLFNIRNENVQIAIAPHASYLHCKKCLGEIYSTLKEEIDTIIILAPDHSNIGKKISLTEQNFLTPLGKTQIDLKLEKEILKNAKENSLIIEENETAHQQEHSIEVQLPYIQTIFKNTKIVPILLENLNYKECINFAKIIYYSIKKLNKKTKIIISSDFTHYGEFYNFTPFKENIRENLHNLDKKAIDFILKFNSENFYNYAKNNTNICGIYSITTGIELAKLFSCNNAKKISYYTSGDFSKDYSISVNYAGIIFKKN